MTKEKILPLTLIVIQLMSAIPYTITGDWRKVVYWLAAAVLNIAVVTNTIPNTGISLPFFSSGGTSLMMLLGEMGIVLSVSRQADAR